MLHLRNYMEEIVFNVMDEILEDMNVCSCEKCKMDIASKALNDLKPQYIVTRKGEIFTKIDNLYQQTETDVLSAVAKAAILIKRSPRH